MLSLLHISCYRDALRGGATRVSTPISAEVNQVPFGAWLGTDPLDESCYLNISGHDDKNDYGYFIPNSNTK